jgi:hypothetical protein
MSRMLIALGAVLTLIVAGTEPASAKHTVGSWESSKRPSDGGAPPGGNPSSNGHGGGHRAGAIQEVSSTATASGNASTASATATCPGGTKSAGGGFDAPSSDGAVPLVYESVKVGNKAWRASAQLLEPGDPIPLTLTTYVYCRGHFPPTKTASTTVPTNGHLQIGPTAEANCSPRRAAVAGGFSMPAPLTGPTVTDLFFDSIRSGDTGWDARVVTGPAGPSTITSEVYCARKGGVPVEATGQSAPNGLDSTNSTATATCPDGLSPAAGGFAQPDSVVFSFFFIDSSRRVDDGWQVSALHIGTDPAIALHAAAYCT